MKRTRTTCRGVTLVELVASLAGASALMAGIASTMFIALRASDPANTPAAEMLRALSCLADVSADVQFALSVPEATATAITVTVPDRSDADTAAETIRYAWSGVAGAPLTRQANGGAVETMLDNVQALILTYVPSAATPKYVVLEVQPTASTRSIVETSAGLWNLP